VRERLRDTRWVTLTNANTTSRRAAKRQRGNNPAIGSRWTQGRKDSRRQNTLRAQFINVVAQLCISVHIKIIG